MRSILGKSILPLICAIGIITTAHDSHALDAPHDATKTITCDTCHIATASTYTYLQGPYTGDGSYNNNLCMNCHYAASLTVTNPKYGDVLTHSSNQTGSTNYGTWMVECVTCHNPHNQRQASVYVKDPLSSIVSGTQSGVGTGTVLSVSKVLSASTLTNYILIPNTLYPAYMYRITGNTTNSITVAAAGAGIPAALRGAGKSFAVKYGKMIKETINAPGIGPTAVKFFNNSGANSFADSDGVINGVCQVCHASTTSFNIGGTLESGHPPNKAGTDCTSCHKHKQGFKADCAACHGSPPINATPGDPNGLAFPATGSTTPGKHAKHAVELGIDCDACHAGYVMPEDPTQIIDLSFSVGSNTGNYTGQIGVRYRGRNGTTVSDPGTGTKTCSNIYCHSNAKLGTGEVTYSPVVWDESSPALNCNSCHVTGATGPNYASGGIGVASSNSHTYHAGGANYDATCDVCHNQTVQAGSKSLLRTDVNPSKHANATKDVVFDPAVNPSASYGSYSCSSTKCHGTTSPQWGRNTANQVCTKCHGRLTPAGTYTLNDAAPGAGGTGISTAGNSANTDAKVGAHRSHLEHLHTINTGVQCNDCHNVPSNVTDAGHMSGLPATVTFVSSLLANTNGASPTYTPGTETCSTTYCHDSGQFKNAKVTPAWSNGTTTTPVWNAPFLGAESAANCNKCHGYPPAGTHPQNIDCSGCHPHVASSDVSFNTGSISLHMNGQVEGGGCDGCHGNPPITADRLVSPATGATSPPSPGGHDKHTNANPLNGRGMTCDACHKGTDMYTDTGLKKIDMGFYVDSVSFPGFNGTVSTGTFTGFDTLSNSFTWSATSPGTIVGTDGTHNNTCALYCHGGGTTGRAALTGGTTTMPSWVLGSSQAACGTCHGGSAFNTASNNPPFTGGHVKHAGSSNLALACNLCHGTTTDMTHVNGVVAWALATTNSKFGASATYNSAASGSTGTLAPSASYANCNNIYCHSTGQSLTSGNSATPTYANPNWGDPGSAACGTCHAATKASVSDANSGSHAKHLNAAGVSGCAACHTGPNDLGTTYSTNTASHVDGQIDVAVSLGYTGSGDPGNGYGTCSANCHNAYGSAGIATPQWGTNATCNSCHPIAADGAPATGSHALHIVTVGTACGVCHAGAVKDLSGGTAHTDGNIDVTNGYPANVTKHPAGTYTGSCSTASCHGSSSPAWRIETAYNTCTKCHGTGTVTVSAGNRYVVAPPQSVAGVLSDATDTGQVSSDSKIGAHQTHLRYLNGLRDTTMDTVDNRCEYCHGTLPTSGTHANSSSTPTFQGLATNNGFMSPSPTYAGTTCNNTYCHNPAGSGGTLRVANAGSGTAPSWTNAAYIDGTLKTQTNCNICHKVPGDAGFEPAGTHGGMTIAGTDCIGCHEHNGGPGGSVDRRHMDGKMYGAGSCNSCHDYDVDPFTGDWGWSPKAIEGWGAHAVHINHLKTLFDVTLSAATDTFGGAAYTQVCGVCHTKDTALHSMSSTTNIRSITFSESTTYQFSVTSGTPTYSGVTGTSSQFAAKTCSNVSCHFQASPVWQGL